MANGMFFDNSVECSFFLSCIDCAWRLKQVLVKQFHLVQQQAVFAEVTDLFRFHLGYPR